MNSFLTKLRKLNIELTVVESKLKINAPKGVLTKEILAEIQENKVAIISYLEGIRSSQKKYETIGKAIQKDSYPLSPAQQRLYFLYQFDKKSTVYNISFAYLVKGPIDIGKLTDAFNSLIDRHEILRTSFQLIDEDVRQIVHEKISCEVEIISKGEESQSQLNATFIQPFDLSIAPLVRIGVVEIKKDENILIFDIHHIIFDGISQEVFVKEFMSLYEGEKLSPVPLQYKDYIEWLETAGQQSAIQRQRAFWLNNFPEIPPKADLPSDYERPAVKKFTGDVISLNLDKEETRRLEELAKKAGVTLNVILFSVYHILLRKLTQQKDIVIGTPVAGRPHPDLSNLMGVFINMLPIRLSLEDDLSIKACISQIKAKFLKALDNQSFQFEELINELQVERDSSRNPLFDFMFAFQNFERPKVELPGLTLEPYPLQNKVSRFDLTLWTYKKGEEINLSFEYSTELFQRDTILRYGNYFKRILRLAQENWDTKIAEIDLLSEEERDELLNGFNATDLDFPKEDTIVSLFEKQVALTPQKVALVSDGEELTFAELNERANLLGHYLQSTYSLEPGEFVGIMLDRTAQMLISILAVLKAGAAYVPIDPLYPNARKEYILKDSLTKVVIVDKYPEADWNFGGDLCVLTDLSIDAEEKGNWVSPLKPSHLCYLIYTSGSTGKPKGVMISHRNVVNFFTGMSQNLTPNPDDCLLAVTTYSFDISVLELLWTLSSGVKVILHHSQESLVGMDRYIQHEDLSMDFSLFFFSSYNNQAEDKYSLLLESVKFADQAGFHAVWTPERHFHEFGGLYPNPSVMSAALAMVTEQINLRSGSVVAPLHDPLRMAEEWSVVDNLSNGRVGLSFASGWHPNDFTLSKADYKERHKAMFNHISDVQRLWRGEKLKRVNGLGNEVELGVFPIPIQSDLPIWITAAGSESTFEKAGAIGANLLTHLLGQSIEDLKGKIKIYKQARAQNGHDPEGGKISLMIHTFIGESMEEVDKIAETPFTQYLKSALGLSKLLFQEGKEEDLNLSEEAEEKLLRNAYRRYRDESSLLGTKATCLPTLAKLKSIGITEVACLVDFGIEEEVVQKGLENLNSLKEACAKSTNRKEESITMIQSTPSFMKLLQRDSRSQVFLANLQKIMMGGEAVPGSLVKKLQQQTQATIYNMYGPTETTIWSCMHTFEPDFDQVSIGRPIANTQVYILDQNLNLLPVGVPGDLYIGGEGVSQGYWRKKELSDERFIPSPFKKDQRIYKTGDVAKWQPNGTLMFLGRKDNQIKISGYRIELGEIENRLLQNDQVSEAAVVVRKENEEEVLVAYVVVTDTYLIPTLKSYLGEFLPHYMVPRYFVELDTIPLTPNGKINKLELPEIKIAESVDYVKPITGEEKVLAEIWSKVLGVKRVGMRDNFFSLGGDSIKSIQIISRARAAGYELSVKNIFTTQTLSELVQTLTILRPESDPALNVNKVPALPVQNLYFHKLLPESQLSHHTRVLYSQEGVGKEEMVSLQSLLRDRHEVLNMSFLVENGMLFQQFQGSGSDGEIGEYRFENRKDLLHSLHQRVKKYDQIFDPYQSPLWKLDLFHLERGSFILIIGNPLILDATSFNILIEEIQMLVECQRNSHKPKWNKTGLYSSWSQKMNAFLKPTQKQRIIPTPIKFDALRTKELNKLPKDFQGSGSQTSIFTQKSYLLDPLETEVLIHQSLKCFRTHVSDLFLTAFYLSCKSLFSLSEITIDIEQSGRSELPFEIDLNRTLGNFSFFRSVKLSPESVDTVRMVKEIKETIRTAPIRLWGHLPPEMEDNTEVSSLFIEGPLSNVGMKFSDFTPIQKNEESLEEIKASSYNENISIENSSYEWEWEVTRSGEQLEIKLTYDTNSYSEETITSLLDTHKTYLLDLIYQCQAYTKLELTPSDLSFPQVPLDVLEELQEEYQIEDIYPLSPAQEGIFLQSSVNPLKYCQQTTYQLTGSLNIEILRSCIQDIVQRHDILRTCFLSEGFDRPIQMVLQERPIDFSYIDIRSTGNEEQTAKFVEEYRAKDKEMGYDLSKNPLMRLSIIQTADNLYEFIWNHHHILMDGWGIGIFFSEFTQLYSKRIRGEELAMRPTQPYAQYIKWIEAQDKTELLAYWDSYLSGYQTPTSIPRNIYSEAKEESYLHRVMRIDLGKELTGQLQQFSRKRGITLSTLFHCAWGILLAKYNNTQDVLFGSVVAGRPTEIEGIETMLGLMLNVIPLRIEIKEADKVEDLLQSVQTRILEWEKYQYHTLAEIQSNSELGQNLFDHIITIENGPLIQSIEEITIGGVENKGVFEHKNGNYSVQTDYPFNITVELSDHFIIQFDYNEHLYDVTILDQIGKYLTNVLTILIKNQNTFIREISLYDPIEEADLQEEYRGNLDQELKFPTIQDRLLESFQRYRTNCAIESGKRQYSFERLGTSASQIFLLLEKYQVPEGAYVAILCEDKYWQIASIIGVLNFRSIFVPLEVGTPTNRLLSILEELDTQFIITDLSREDLTEIDNSSRPVTWINIQEAQTLSEGTPKSGYDRKKSYDPEDTIYTYFTSGSTGKPGGVLGTNKGLNHFIEWEINHFSLDESFRFSQFINPGFDAFLRDILVPLCVGGTLCIPDKDSLSSPNAIYEWIHTEKINLIHCVPSFFKLINRAELKVDHLKELNFVLMAGEKIIPLELRKWYNTYGDRIRLVNLYGSTETTLAKGFHPIQLEDIHKRFIPVFSMPGSQFLLLDKDKNISPDGAIGEVYIRTPYMTRGYFNDVDRNRNYIVPNPFGERTDDLLHRTGDLGRKYIDGNLEILGRVDRQVKIRGIRIELEEIKEQILTCEGIHDAVVTVGEDEESEKFLCAYYISQNNVNFDQLRKHLLEYLPLYMVPSYLVPISQIPLTPNGKVDYKTLPLPTSSLIGNNDPVNSKEERLVQIWAEVLNLKPEQIGANKSFFELGGHSIKVFHLINKIQKEFKIKLKLGDVFKNMTIHKLTKFIADKGTQDFLKIPRLAEAAYYPASPAQERIYFKHLLNKRNLPFHLFNILEIKGELDIVRLKRAFQQLIDKHEVLRTSFHLTEEGLQQKINQGLTFEFEFLDGSKDFDLKRSFEDFIQPFDLSHTCQMRVALLLTEERGNYVFIDIHHIVADGFSLGLIANEIRHFYFNSSLPELNLRYVDYAGWVRTNGHAFELQKDFWKEKLSSNVPKLNLPISRSRANVDIESVSSKALELEENLSYRIGKYIVEKGVSEYMFFLSIYFLLLSKITENEEVILGAEVLGRNHPELYKLIGTFVNVLPLGIQVNPEESYEEFLERVKKVVLEAFDNQDFQFNDMVALVNEEKETGRSPIFDVHFSYGNTAESNRELEELDLVPVSLGELVKGEYEFSIHVAKVDGKIRLLFIYRDELYEVEIIKLMMRYYYSIVEEVIENEFIRINEIDLDSSIESLQYVESSTHY